MASSLGSSQEVGREDAMFHGSSSGAAYGFMFRVRVWFSLSETLWQSTGSIISISTVVATENH